MDGAEPTAANIKNGVYRISRPFNIATRKDVSEAAKDFISFILSSDGQKVVEDSGYIAVSENGPYNGTRLSGKIVVAGVAKEAADRLAPAAQKKQVSLSVSGERSIISGVRQILEEMIINLYDNAIKYNNINGRVDVSVISEDGDVILNALSQFSDAGVFRQPGQFLPEVEMRRFLC